MYRAWMLAIAIAATSACTPSIPEGRFECDVDEDCPPGQRCEDLNHRCYEPDGG